MNNIGERFVDITNKLDEMGVFYGKNYDGKFHDKYPHSGYWFSIDLDKHRNSFVSIINDSRGERKTIATVRGNNPSLMIVELLEESYDYFHKELNIKNK